MQVSYSLQIKFYPIWGKIKYYLNFQVVQNVCRSVYLLLKFSALYWMSIPTFRKNVLFTSTCTWTGIAPWDWKQYFSP